VKDGNCLTFSSEQFVHFLTNSTITPEVPHVKKYLGWPPSFFWKRPAQSGEKCKVSSEMCKAGPAAAAEPLTPPPGAGRSGAAGRPPAGAGGPPRRPGAGPPRRPAPAAAGRPPRS